MLVQIQNIYTIFGDEHAKMFLLEFLENERYFDFVLPNIQLSGMYFDNKKPPDFATISSMIQWCILGDFDDLKKSPDPIARFKLLVDYYKVNQIPS